MVLTVAQNEDFFEGVTQTVTPSTTVVQLQHKDISYVDNLIDLDKESLGQADNNIRCSGEGVNNFMFGAKSHKHLLIACFLLH